MYPSFTQAKNNKVAVRKFQADSWFAGYKLAIDGDWGRKTQGVADNIFHTTSIKIETLADMGRIHDRFVRSSLEDTPTSIKSFGKLEYRDVKGGWVEITNDYEYKHMVVANLPIYGRLYVNKRILEPAIGAMKFIKQEGFDNEYPITQMGCFAPRHKVNNIRRDLSTHAYAIGIDVNHSRNTYGTWGDMHPGIVYAFRKFGFIWGGFWNPLDSMHFQYIQNY